MRVLIQRVLSSGVSIEGEVVGSCKKGYMILFCAVEGDSKSDVELLAKKNRKSACFG